MLEGNKVSKEEEVDVKEVVFEESVKEVVVKKPTPKANKKVIKEKAPHVDVKPDKIPVKKKLGKTKGYIRNCNALRLREGANIKTKVMAIMPKDSALEIDLDNSTDTFYEVTYKGIIGFCVKSFIELG